MSDDSATVIGLDWGASRVRLAVNRGGAATSIAHQPGGRRPPFGVRLARAGDGPGVVEVIALKQLIDSADGADGVDALGLGLTSTDTLAGVFRVALRECAEGTVRCVVTVPPGFSERQRAATRTAALRADVVGVRLMNDTNAALLGAQALLRAPGSVLVVSWGASTLSAAFYRLDAGRLRLVAQEGTGTLGGDSIDAAIATSLLSAMAAHAGRQALFADRAALHRVVEAAERAKLILASGRPVVVPLTSVASRKKGTAAADRVRLEPGVFRAALEPMIADALRVIERVLAAAGCTQPAAIVGVGGMMGLPEVARAIEAHCRVPITLAPDDVVARGAALYGAQLEPSDWEACAQSNPVDRVVSTTLVNKLTMTGMSRSAQCPCGSGRKYKRCCGR